MYEMKLDVGREGKSWAEIYSCDVSLAPQVLGKSCLTALILGFIERKPAFQTSILKDWVITIVREFTYLDNKLKINIHKRNKVPTAFNVET